MATLGQVGELVTTQLRERVDRLESAVEEDSPDFAEVSYLADAVGELADQIAMIYSDLEEILIGGVRSDSASKGQSEDSRGQRAKRVRSEQRPQQHADENGTTDDDVTKEELLERARETNVHGRSSMSKEELAQAVEAEESQTKEELLERARRAEIEGRSSMTKDELREALTDADA